jgi:hypothetical protein
LGLSPQPWGLYSATYTFLSQKTLLLYTLKMFIEHLLCASYYKENRKHTIDANHHVSHWGSSLKKDGIVYVEKNIDL